MRLDDIEEKRRERGRRICEALRLDPGVTTDLHVVREAYRVEWTALLSAIDFNNYSYYRAESHSSVATVGLDLGRHFDNEAWAEVLAAEDEWMAVFAGAYKALDADHYLNAPAIGECNRCHRKTWDAETVGTEDRMTQPDGGPCGGTFEVLS